MFPKIFICVALIVFSLYSCKPKQDSTTTLFELKENTGIDFSNNVADTKDFNVLTYRNFYNGGGVATGDIYIV
jgi:hypothetical protein